MTADQGVSGREFYANSAAARANNRHTTYSLTHRSRGPTMTELLRDPLFLSLATGVLIVLGTTLIGCWTKARRVALEAELKRDMIARGMSADEICQVIQATTGDACERPKSHV